MRTKLAANEMHVRLFVYGSDASQPGPFEIACGVRRETIGSAVYEIPYVRCERCGDINGEIQKVASQNVAVLGDRPTVVAITRATNGYDRHLMLHDREAAVADDPFYGIA